MSEATTCSPDPFTPVGEKPYRYFNQPIEQIPGWDKNQPQVLVHSINNGLMWKSVECLDIVTCIKLENNELKIERRNITILADKEPEPSVCPNIPTTDCPT